MMGPEEIRKGLWTFPIVLPNNPLKWLNCYVIKPENSGRCLMIDTGFDRPECREAIFSAMTQLEIRPENTDIFITHIHSDHTGNASILQGMGFGIIMGKADYELFAEGEDARWSAGKSRAMREGMPKSVCDAVTEKSRALIYTSGPISPRTVTDGQRLSYGDYCFECVETPGHSPGHMCLYESRHKLMILGDHILFDITPNICAWSCMADSLGTYLESLDKISGYDIALALPAHRNCSDISVAQRIAQLKEHHMRRLSEARSIVESYPGMNAYQIAGKMTWQLRGEDWEHSPEGQRYFAVSETLAHLDRLVNSGQIIRRTTPSGMPEYYC